MAPTYDLWIDDDAGNQIAQMNNTSGFRYIQTLNGIGAFAIDLPKSFNTTLLRRDAYIEIWRGKGPGNLSLRFLGLLRRWRYVTRERQTTIVLSGVDLNHLIKRRYILYQAGTSQASANAEAADDLIKRIVDENLGASATDTDRDLTGKGLTIEGNLTQGPTITKGFAWKNVLKILLEIAEESKQKGTPLYFGIKPNSPTAWDFITRITQWGQDRTSLGQQVNISQNFKNIENPELEFDSTDELTHVTGAGRGLGEARIVPAAVTDSARLTASRFNRIEGFKNASGRETTTAGIQGVAKELLEKNRPFQRFKCDLVETDEFRLGEHWDFGDKLRWDHLDRQGDATVRQVDIRVDGRGKETIRAKSETEL